MGLVNDVDPISALEDAIFRLTGACNSYSLSVLQDLVSDVIEECLRPARLALQKKEEASACPIFLKGELERLNKQRKHLLRCLGKVKEV